MCDNTTECQFPVEKLETSSKDDKNLKSYEMTQKYW